MVVLPHSKKVLKIQLHHLAMGLSVWRLHVLPIFAWVFFRYASFHSPNKKGVSHSVSWKLSCSRWKKTDNSVKKTRWKGSTGPERRPGSVIQLECFLKDVTIKICFCCLLLKRKRSTLTRHLQPCKQHVIHVSTTNVRQCGIAVTSTAFQITGLSHYDIHTNVIMLSTK